MKKIILVLVSIIAVYNVNAQSNKENSKENYSFKKGDVFVSGKLGIESNDLKFGNEITTTTFSFIPKAGYFLTDNFVVGAGFAYGTTKATTNSSTLKTNTWVIDAIARYYFPSKSSNFNFYAGLEGGYVFSRFIEDVKIKGFAADLGVGVNYFISPSLSIEAQLSTLSYESLKAHDLPSSRKGDSFSLNTDLSDVKFGINYKF